MQTLIQTLPPEEWRTHQLVKLTNYLLDLVETTLSVGDTEDKREEDVEVCSLLQALGVELSDISPYWVRGEVTSIRRIFDNIVSNAKKFTPKGGAPIQAFLASKGSQVQVEIVDMGVGIPPDRFPLLFTPFATGNTPGLRGEKSTGLGLSIVQQLLEKIGGEIAMESTPFRGTTVRLTFREGLLQGLKRKLGGRIPERVLVVEDEPVASVLLRQQLREMGVLHVDTVCTGGEALEKEKEGIYAFLLLDSQLPDMTGADVARILRAKGKNPHIPILGMTASCAWQDKNRCVEAGMDACLTKPLPLATLWEALFY